MRLVFLCFLNMFCRQSTSAATQMCDFCGILSSSSLLYVFPLCPPLVGFHFSNFVYFLLVLPLSVHGDTVCKPYQFSQSVSCSIQLRKCVISVAFSPPPRFFVYFLLVLPLSVSTFRLFEFGFHFWNCWQTLQMSC